MWHVLAALEKHLLSWKRRFLLLMGKRSADLVWAHDFEARGRTNSSSRGLRESDDETSPFSISGEAVSSTRISRLTRTTDRDSWVVSRGRQSLAGSKPERACRRPGRAKRGAAGKGNPEKRQKKNRSGPLRACGGGFFEEIFFFLVLLPMRRGFVLDISVRTLGSTISPSEVQQQ